MQNIYFCIMSRWIAVLCCVLYLLASTEAKQFLKVPVLLQHFEEHQQKSDNLSFLDFIYMHYAGSDFDDSDQDRDDQLPFKTPFSPSASDSFLPTAAKPFVEPNNTPVQELKFPQSIGLHCSYFPSIWQPPKIS